MKFDLEGRASRPLTGTDARASPQNLPERFYCRRLIILDLEDGV